MKGESLKKYMAKANLDNRHIEEDEDEEHGDAMAAAKSEYAEKHPHLEDDSGDDEEEEMTDHQKGNALKKWLAKRDCY